MSVKPLSLDDSAANSRTSRRRSGLAQPASSAVSSPSGTMLVRWWQGFISSFRGGGVWTDVALVNVFPLADTQYFGCRTLPDLAGSQRCAPAQASGRRLQRRIFAADPAVVADVVEQPEQVAVVDLAGARLVAARRVGQLDVFDQRQVGADRVAQFAFHALHMIDVVLQEQIRPGAVGDQLD